MTSTLNNLNFIEGGNEIVLYGIDLVSDIISKYDEKNETVFTGDCHHEDVLITQDTGEIFPRVQQAIQLKMDYMATVRSQTANCTYLDAVCFTGVIITRNGEPLFRIPITFHGHSAGASLNTYGIEFRTALNSKGASAYSIDFDNIEVCQAHSPELKLFAKGLPRRAARTLNGAALQDELGM